MANSNDPIRDIFLAGIGALAMGAEKSQEIVKQLVEKGQLTVEQGKEMEGDLRQQTSENLSKLRDDIISSHMKTMTKEQRDEFAAHVAEMAATIDEDDQLQKEEDEEVKAATKSK